MTEETTWAQVASTSPFEVLFAGDSRPTQVELRDSTYSPAEGDKVALVKVGAQWVVFAKITPA